jgi:amidase
MQIATRDKIYIQHSRLNEPAITIQPGEIFQVETELCSGAWLTSIDDRYDPANPKIFSPNPTVVIAVAGAKPGDMLAVQIQKIDVDTIGYTGFQEPANPLARLILNREWGQASRTLAIEDGVILWSEKIRILIQPMIGTLGTAPAREELLNSKGGPHGGNMDAQEVTVGSTVYLPVLVNEALLHVGDVHAIQGDGEINMAGGVECRSRVTLKVELTKRPSRTASVRIENADYIMAIACERSIEESFYAAAREVLYWMVDDFGFTEEEAYLLMGQVMEARCTQFVNPTRTYICKMPKKYLLMN